MERGTNHTGYGVGHSWYYVLGGAILTPKEIRAEVWEAGYRGYRAEDIDSAHKKPEPNRSRALSKIRAQVIKSLRDDLRRYRKLACELRVYRREHPGEQDAPVCRDVHFNISVKFAHIYNGFAHLETLEALPERQLDLFGY